MTTGPFYYRQLGTGNAYSEAKIDFSGSGDNTLVAAVTGKVIRVYRMFLVVSAATSLTFKDGSTALTGAMSLAANSAITFDETEASWFTTTTATALVLNSSVAVQVGGRLYYGAQ